MASGSKEHRMVFDIRGRRKYAVKVVYAVLAVLMGVSLFLVVGPLNIGELLGTGSSGNAAAQFEEDAQRVERRLQKEPENEQLLLTLTRARVNAANSLYEGGVEEERTITPEAVQQLRLAGDSWSRYLDATDEPNVGAAQLLASNLLVLAQYSRTFPEAQANVEAAAEAEQLVADQRPNLNSLTTLAFYVAILGENKKAQKLADEAEKYASSKFERENIDNQVGRYENVGREFQKSVKAAEEQEGEAGKQSLETPLQGLGGGALGGATLGE